jgi:hypothetical protein
MNIKEPIALQLIDVNYDERFVEFKTNTDEYFKCSFEYIQDVASYTKKEGDWIWDKRMTVKH